MSELLRTGHYIGGEWYESAETYAVRNPATGEVIAQVAKGGAAETAQAIAAAERALSAWRALTAKERGARVRRWGELMLEHRDALAELLTREQGKPLAEARGMVRGGSEARLWRRDSEPESEREDHRDARTGGRRRGHHAVEFPARDDHAQGRSRARGRLHDGA
jgi:acyl-CoA reductase-like NAD-dependent aldehyde dehydrogenase